MKKTAIVSCYFQHNYGSMLQAYVPDLKKYDQTFAFYTPIYSWGFSVCESNGELVASVRRFDRKSYTDSVKENHKLFGNAETGAAIEYVYKYIVETN